MASGSGVGSVSGAGSVSGVGSGSDESFDVADLERLEGDLAAVAEAMAGLDRVDADGLAAHAAAVQVAAIVDSDRFTVTPPVSTPPVSDPPVSDPPVL